MEIVDFSSERAAPITRYQSVGASSVTLGDGTGEAHVHCLRFAPGGAIGRHPTGFAQLFLVVEGSGWVEGADGERVALSAGQGAWFARGESHAKGSDRGMTAVMIQVDELAPRADARA
jgi:quercetin dioxygenase-like cupin family protein